MRNKFSSRQQRFHVEACERRLMLVGDVLQPTFNPGFSTGINSPSQQTLTVDVLPIKVDPNYTGGTPTGTVTVGWWGGPVLGTATVSSTPVTIPLTLDQSNAGTEVPAGNNFAYHYVLYVDYQDSGDFASSIFTAEDFASYEAQGVPGYGVVFNNNSANIIAVTAQPTNTAAGDKIDPVSVAELTSSGSVNTSANSTITATITSASTGTGKLTGTLTAATVNGVAKFSNLSIDTPGQYSLTFTDATGATTSSGLFQITGGRLIFKPGPTNGSAGDPLKPISVLLEDSKGKIINSDSSSVVTLTPIGIKANPVITGNVQQLVDGVATFSGLTLQNADL